MAELKYFEALLNPLSFLQIDEPWSITSNSKVSHEEIFKYLCTPGLKTDIESLVNRYREISKEKQRLIAAPVEENILSKLVYPLHHAKASYMVGNYLGTISLCGMVAEMCAILLFDISNIQINEEPLYEKGQIGLFGSTFEKLGQERRINVLFSYGLIDDDLKSHFYTVKQTRRKYLHFYSHEHSKVETDSVDIFLSASTIVVNIIGQNVKDGKIILNPLMLKYLKDKGMLKTK